MAQNTPLVAVPSYGQQQDFEVLEITGFDPVPAERLSSRRAVRTAPSDAFLASIDAVIVAQGSGVTRYSYNRQLLVGDGEICDLQIRSVFPR